MTDKIKLRKKIEELFKNRNENRPPQFPNSVKFKELLEEEDYEKIRDFYVDIELLDSYLGLNIKYFLDNDDVSWENRILKNGKDTIQKDIIDAQKSIGTTSFMNDYFKKLVKWSKEIISLAESLIEYSNAVNGDLKKDGDEHVRTGKY